MTTARSVTPEEAAAMIRDGAILVDIRSTDEHRRLRIPGAQSAPLDRLPAALPDANGRKVIFHCRSGMRTAASAAHLAASTGGQSCILAGGLNAWRKSGFPVVEDRGQPLEVMRQVQILTGALILAGCLLGTFVAPAFYALSGFVGVGLLTAGITGFCGMARLLTWFGTRTTVNSQ